VVAGEASALGAGSWRYAFFVLAIPSVAAAFALRRFLPEPARGGRGSLERGAQDFAPTTAADPSTAVAEDTFERSEAQEEISHSDVSAVPDLVLRSDPENMSIWASARYVLRVRTNVVLIIASSLGYFYFTGVTTFGLVLFQERYHVAHGSATLLLTLVGLAGLGGVIAGGRFADNRMRRGDVNSRITVGAWSFIISAFLFGVGLLSHNVFISLVLFMLAGLAFGARNPPLDAARLDIMHHRLWGRAEAVRMLLRQLMTAGAPILFGVIADAFAPPGAAAHGNGSHGFGANANGHGLELAFLFFLISIVLGGLLTFVAKRTYPQDVATALASEAATRRDKPAEAPARRS
jgi:MFS family permease